MKKKKKYTFYSAEEKLEYINLIMSGEFSLSEIARNNNLSAGMLSNWKRQYNEKGIDGLINKPRTGNRLAKYHRKKNLTDIEKLEYENLLLRIENERLKKGYTNEEVKQIRLKK